LQQLPVLCWLAAWLTAASAEVTFTGDARERLVMQEKYNSNKKIRKILVTVVFACSLMQPLKVGRLQMCE